MTTTPAQQESPWPHRFAVLLCCATFPLIWVGGLVTSHDAGMAVPDWPSTYGSNLFLYPWQTWLFGPFDIFVEHGHRLLGALVGLITIGLVVSVFWQDRRRWMRFAALGSLALVIGQGVLGGGRVILNERLLAQLHGCLGPLFFAYAACLAVVTSRLWREAHASKRVESSPLSPLPSPPSSALPADPRLVRLGWITVGLLYIQLILGSFLRHATAAASRDQFRLWVMFHLIMAVVVTGHLLVWSHKAAWHRTASNQLKWPARGLALLILLQLALGMATWVVNYGWPIWLQSYAFAASFRIQAQGMLQSMVVTGHVATGSLLLAISATLALRQSRLLAGKGQSQAVAASSPSPTKQVTLKGVLA